jgi:hypothetical protein
MVLYGNWGKEVDMDIERSLGKRLSRRTFVGVGTGAGASLLMAACGVVRVEDADDDDVVVDDDDDDTDPSVEEEDDDVDVDEPDDDDEEPVDDDDEERDVEDEDEDDEDDEVDEEDEDDEEEVDDEEPAEERVIVADVIDYTLDPDGRWDGPFGSVTMQLHQGWVDGEDVTFIRTDASDSEFAGEEGLVYVPLLANALDEPGSYGDLYLFREAPDGQLPVMSSSPADGDSFSPAFRIHYVTVVGKIAAPLTSASEIRTVADGGGAMIDTTDIIVNYPVITWPGGQIPVDEDKTEALGGGQLIEAPDIEGGEVTLKLHQCYPGSRYIITDTSALPMAPMMGAGEAGGTQLLIDAGAVAPITVFMNGLEGTGAMGYQPGVFNTNAGDPAWSPFWEHFTAEWVNPDDAVPVTSQSQLDDLVAAGDLILYGGVPDTDPDTFVVNCSVPILAPVTWEPPE